MRSLLAAVVLLALGGCATGAGGSDGSGDEGSGAAALRGFGVEVDQAVAPQVPVVHLKTCGSWGCHEQDVPLHISGPTSAMPCPSDTAAPDAACGVAQLAGPGPGYGYAPVPALTFDEVTVTVSTPSGAPLRINAEVRVRPTVVCPDRPGKPGGGAEPAGGAEPGEPAGAAVPGEPAGAAVPGEPAGAVPGEPGGAAMSGEPGGAAAPGAGTTCPGGTPQARLRIAADGTVSQSR
jgi:hypothetical protein